MILEGNETGVIKITAAQIKYSGSIRPGVLYCSPEQQRRTLKSIEASIGATILIGNDILER